MPAAAQVGDTGSVVGVDLSPAMVTRAGEALRTAGVDGHVDLHVMDAEHMELAAGSFDVVLCAFGVFFFPRPAQAMAEVVRVIRVGGLVGVSSWAEEDDRWAWEHELLADLVVSRRAIEQAFDHPRDLEQLLVDAGLEDVRSQLEHHEIVFATEAEWWEWKWSYSVRGIFEQVDDTARERYRRASFDAMQPFRTSSGFPMRLAAAFAFGRKPR